MPTLARKLERSALLELLAIEQAGEAVVAGAPVSSVTVSASESGAGRQEAREEQRADRDHQPGRDLQLGMACGEKPGVGDADERELDQGVAGKLRNSKATRQIQT